MPEDVKQTVQDAADTLGDRMQERKADMKFGARLKAIERNVAQVDTRIEALGKRFPRTRGPRFPFGLVLLAGLGYALYNPSSRRKVFDLIGNVSPAARDTLEGMLGRAGEAADEMKDRKDPAAVMKNAASDIGQKARDNVQDVRHDVQKAGDRLADRAGDVTDDARRTTDRLADRTQDKLNDLKH